MCQCGMFQSGDFFKMSTPRNFNASLAEAEYGQGPEGERRVCEDKDMSRDQYKDNEAGERE